MANEITKKRITEYATEVTVDELDNSDVIFIDSTQHGTRKLRLKGIRDIISGIQNESIKSSGVSVTADNYATTITNVDNQPVNTIYTYAAGLQSNISNLPSNNALNIMHYTYKYSVATNVGQVQIAIERSGENPAMYFRTTGGTPVSWSSWVKMANNADVEAIREELDNLDIETDETLSISGKPADAKATGDAIDEVKADLNQFEETVLDEKVVSAEYQTGRYLASGGFNDNVTTYARNKNAFPAGKYHVSANSISKFVAGYITDTEGINVIGNYFVTEQTFESEHPFYINFYKSGGFTEQDLAGLATNFIVTKIINEDDSIVARLDNIESQMLDIETISNAFITVTSINRYDGGQTAGGYIAPNTGVVTTNPGHSYSDWIDISNHNGANIIYSNTHHSNVGFSNMRWAFYSDANENSFISGGIAPTLNNDATLNRDYAVLTTPTNAKYMRFSLPTANFGLAPDIMVEYGAITEYHSYVEDGTCITDEYVENNPIIQKTASITYGKKPSQATSETLTDGNTLIVEYNSVMKNQYIAFVADISGSFSGVTVGHGQESYGYGIKVDETNISYWSNGSVGSSVPHGLTIEEFVGVIIEVDVELNVKTTIVTKGGYFTKTQQINSSWRGNVFATSDGTSFNNAVLTWNSDDYKCPLWAFGDSYFTLYSPTRWPYYIANKWGFNNILLNAYPGENSERAYSDFTNALTHGTPKYLLWCLGMNDPDSASAPNASWLATVQSIVEICNQKGITLILATIPDVTNAAYKNTYKNEWIRSSGKRYVDFADALANVDGWLSDDGVHPNEIGGRFMALKLLADVPEIAQGK